MSFVVKSIFGNEVNEADAFVLPKKCHFQLGGCLIKRMCHFQLGGRLIKRMSQKRTVIKGKKKNVVSKKMEICFKTK